jgi:nucleotide-binding universal stress UspA family protein
MTTVMPFRGGVPVFAPTLLDEYTKNAQHYLTGLQTSLRANQIEVKPMVKIGVPITTILEMAEQEKVDLIAMASHGRTGLARVFYGSVTAGVMQQVDRPLLLIRAQG